MKTFTVEFRNGHLVEIGTGNQVFLLQNKQYVITGVDNDFKKVELLLEVPEKLDSAAKREKVEKKYGKENIQKILSAGTELVFRVGLGRRKDDFGENEFLFLSSILEDLYIYRNDNSGWYFADCVCIVERCIEGGLIITNPIPAKSLNQLFTNTVSYFFPLQRSTSANAFTTFFIKEKNMQVTMNHLKSNALDSLDKFRPKK